MRSKIFKDQDHKINFFYDPGMLDQKITNNFDQKSFIFDPFGLKTVKRDQNLRLTMGQKKSKKAHFVK